MSESTEGVDRRLAERIIKLFEDQEKAKTLFRHIMKYGIDSHRVKVQWTRKEYETK